MNYDVEQSFVWVADITERIKFTQNQNDCSYTILTSEADSYYFSKNIMTTPYYTIIVS